MTEKETTISCGVCGQKNVAAGHRCEMHPQGKAEVAWLIEGGAPQFYWMGRGVLTWTSNANDALRFARREDAERVIHWVINNPALRAVEHAWMEARAEGSPQGWRQLLIEADSMLSAAGYGRVVTKDEMRELSGRIRKAYEAAPPAPGSAEEGR